MSNLLRQVRHTEIFLRLAAIELRRIAERAPDVGDQLRHIASKFEADAAELARRAGD